jgi:hypothetical protein
MPQTQKHVFFDGERDFLVTGVHVVKLQGGCKPNRWARDSGNEASRRDF